MYKLINGNDISLVALERPPVYLGGFDNFLYELGHRIVYPEDALKKGITGKVFVSFIVDKNGKTSNFKVLKSAGPELDEEAIRAIKLVPEQWFPGIINGKAVDIEISYPVTFNIRTRTGL